jgi:hypothetical protein
MARIAKPEPREDREDSPRRSMSVTEIFEAIANDTEESPNRAQNPSVTHIAIDLQMCAERGTLDLSSARGALANLTSIEDQIEALRALQSLIGRQRLKKALFPTIEDLLAEMDAESPHTPLGVLNPTVLVEVTNFNLLVSLGQKDRGALETVLAALPSRTQKKALLLHVQMGIGPEDFDTLVGR